MEWIALLLAFPLGGAAAVVCWYKLNPWRIVRARRVMVNLKSGQAVDGLLVRHDGPLLFLAQASLHEGAGDPIPLDGQALVERQNIDFIQIL